MYIPGEGILSIEDFIERLPEVVQSTKIIRTNKKLEYYNIPAAFDTETTSFYQDGIKDPDNKRAIMYCWAYGIGNIVTFGRTWEEFLMLNKIISHILNLSETRRLITYVHNLPYEFQFMRKRIKWDKVFLMEERKVVYALSKDGIEYRCSLKLAGGKSLANVGKDLQKYPLAKMVGDLDYDVIRSPITPMTDKEKKYVENDVRVLLHYIQEKIESDGDITKIPLTNTGYVRNYCRKACYEKWHPYRKFITALTLTPDDYSQLKDTFQGGFTHANPKYVNQVIDDVHSYDFASSYPAVMLLEKFPMSRAELIDREVSKEELKTLLRTKCCMFDVEFTELHPKLFQDNPISQSKCTILEEPVINNGRVSHASRLKTSVTEQDFITYSVFYDWEECRISNLKVFDKEYLPTALAKSILELYYRKTTLKGFAGEEVNYMISKNMINAAYGMMVTDIIRDEYTYVDNDYPDPIKPNPKIAIDKYNKNIKRFLYYPWGVWVTAYARANLFSGIYELGQDYIYSDTDSVKFKNIEAHQQYFDAYNAGIKKKIEAAATFHKIDPADFSPLNKTIGVWDYDGHYEQFKTLGAKRYLTKDSHGYHLTVAGANKKMACQYLVDTGDPFGNFKDQLVIPESHSGRKVLTYIDKETKGTLVDCNGVPYHYNEKSSIHMEGTSYSLSLSKAFKDFLGGKKDYGYL